MNKQRIAMQDMREKIILEIDRLNRINERVDDKVLGKNCGCDTPLHYIVALKKDGVLTAPSASRGGADGIVLTTVGREEAEKLRSKMMAPKVLRATKGAVAILFRAIATVLVPAGAAWAAGLLQQLKGCCSDEKNTFSSQ
jgi:hypothetical protein